VVAVVVVFVAVVVGVLVVIEDVVVEVEDEMVVVLVALGSTVVYVVRLEVEEVVVTVEPFVRFWFDVRFNATLVRVTHCNRKKASQTDALDINRIARPSATGGFGSPMSPGPP